MESKKLITGHMAVFAINQKPYLIIFGQAKAMTLEGMSPSLFQIKAMKIFALFGIIIMGCLSSPKNKVQIEGIWIPKNVNWKEGGFATYFFDSDSTVITITSTQKKIKDSIYFEAEPGFNILKDSLKLLSNNTYILKSKALCRFIKLPGISGNEIYTDTIIISENKNGIRSTKINNKQYIPGELYTQKSKHSIYSIVTKMVPEIEKHPERFN